MKKIGTNCLWLPLLVAILLALPYCGGGDDGDEKETDASTPAADGASATDTVGEEIADDDSSGPSPGGCGVSGLVAEVAQLSHTHLAVDDDCHIYLFHDNGLEKKIIRLSATGEESTFSTNAQFEELGQGLKGVYVNAGNELMATTSTSVVRFDSSGSATVVFDGGEALGFQAPQYLSMDGDGNIYVSNFMGGSQKVFKITPDGTSSVLVEPADPTGIGTNAMLASGDLLYFGNNSIMKVPAGSTTEEAYVPDMEEQLLALHGEVPAVAIEVGAGLRGHTFAIDENGTVYAKGGVDYNIKEENWTAKKFHHLLAIKPDGTVESIMALEEGLDPAELVYRKGTIFFYSFSWETMKHEIHALKL